MVKGYVSATADWDGFGMMAVVSDNYIVYEDDNGIQCLYKRLGEPVSMELYEEANEEGKQKFFAHVFPVEFVYNSYQDGHDTEGLLKLLEDLDPELFRCIEMDESDLNDEGIHQLFIGDEADDAEEAYIGICESADQKDLQEMLSCWNDMKA